MDRIDEDDTCDLVWMQSSEELSDQSAVGRADKKNRCIDRSCGQCLDYVSDGVGCLHVARRGITSSEAGTLEDAQAQLRVLLRGEGEYVGPDRRSDDA